MQTEQALILLLETGLPADRAGLSEDIPIYEQVTGVSICLFQHKKVMKEYIMEIQDTRIKIFCIIMN